MEIVKISRRQFLGGAAAVVGAAVLPAFIGVTPAAATPTGTFPGTLSPWVPLDAQALARKGYEIYKGKWTGQSG
jgi:hypothetical protein